MSDEEYIHDEDLLMEAARYAVSKRESREHFMSQAKKCWYKAANQRGLNPQTLRPAKEG